ncbi:cytokine-like nuclear factor N-PAC isoform X2 [Diabrotica virgifera virgifera]|uniref:Cytokine-like nuclear factor N-PAC n=1 Tax=Diabrotica virgifera virgifera TaxID=50390 RepID=A0A6P7FY06_DIAVI|nr:cytokine-like nuclear factor N-PAC isoform X2 [Diabrotica virgifera virgifera]
MSSEINVGDLVWAKMKTFSPWPARVVQPGPNTPSKTGKKDMHWVYFFGSKNYAWIESSNVKPYEEYKDKFISSNKSSTTSQFKKAIVEIEEFREKLAEDPNYELPLPENKTPSKEKSEEDPDKKFNKLLSSKKSVKKTPTQKRRSLDDGSGPSTSKKSRRSSPRLEENGVRDYSKLHDLSSDAMHRRDVGLEILNRHALMDEPEEDTDFNLGVSSKLLETKNINPSTLKFGFIGLGTMGTGIVKNLINSGHKVNIYNRTTKKSDEFKAKADQNNDLSGLVNTFITPCDVMQNSDIVFSCVSDPTNAKENVVGNCGILKAGDYLEGKGYVEMTSINPKDSQDICEMIRSKGGRYLEAQVQGSKREADDGTLVVLTAGDQALFLDCQSCFKAMGKTSFYLGPAGAASKASLILQIIKGVSLVGMAEALGLADRCGISTKDVLKIFNLTDLSSDYLSNKAESMMNKGYDKQVHQALKHMQTNLRLVLDMSEDFKQPLLMTSTANELYKHARRLGCDDRDVSCVYIRTKL